MAPKLSVNAVKKKIISHLDTKFTGSGDLELDDALDIIQFLTQEYEKKPRALKQVLQQVLAKVEALDPAWAASRPAWSVEYPSAPASEADVVELCLAPWHTGFLRTDSIKGKSKTVYALGVIEDFLDKPYVSANDPVRVLNPKRAVEGTPLVDFSLRLDVGMSKSLATKMIPLAVHALNLTNTELQAILPQLKAIYTVKATFQPAEDGRQQIKKSLGSKMQLAKRPSPDVVQMSWAWLQQAQEEGRAYAEIIEELIAEYNEGSTDRKNISEGEAAVVKILPAQTEECRNKIEYHWQNFKTQESALTLGHLSDKAWLQGTTPKNQTDALWKEILKGSPDKRASCVFRWIGIFVTNLKNAARLQKSVNLRVRAAKMRDQKDIATAYEVAALFTHFAPEFQRALSASAWQKLIAKFKRGGLDQELAEKVAHKDPNINVNSFRFLEGLGATLDRPASSVEGSADAPDVTVAEENLQKSELENARVKLQREGKRWASQLEAVRLWKCKSEAAKGEHRDAQEASNREVLEKHAELVFPGRDLAAADHIMTFTASSTQAYADHIEMDADVMFKVIHIDFTIPGYKYPCNLAESIASMAAHIAASPERSVGIVLAPNTGPYGDEYTDSGIKKAVNDVEAELSDAVHGLIFREGSIIFQEGTIHPSSKRPGWHRMWICLSDQTVVDPKTQGGRIPKSLFRHSLLWTRYGVVRDAPALPMPEWVNPLLKVNRGKPGRDWGKGARRKQWTAGWKLAHAIKTVLWKDMPITTTSAAVHIVLHGYDTSVHEAVMRYSGMAPFKGPREIVVSCFWVTMDTDLAQYHVAINTWMKDSLQRVMRKLIEEQKCAVPGWTSTTYTDSVQRPAYQESEYKLTYPTAANTLPVRSDWLDMMTQKFTIPALKEEFDKLIKEHNQVHNPTEQPYNPTRGVPRPAPAPTGDVRVDPLPEVGGHPTTKEELLAADPSLVMISSLGQEFYWSVDRGDVWMWGLTDDVIPQGSLVTLIYGEFLIGSEDIEKATTQQQKKLLMWRIESQDYQGIFGIDSSQGAAEFPQTAQPLSAFLEFLEQNGKHNIAIDLHVCNTKYERDDFDAVIGRSWEITPSEQCGFTPLRVAEGRDPNKENAGTFAVQGPGAAKWNWQDGMHADGILCMMRRMAFMDSAQFAGIIPEKPGICFAKAVRVVKDTLRKVG